MRNEQIQQGYPLTQEMLAVTVSYNQELHVSATLTLCLSRPERSRAHGGLRISVKLSLNGAVTGIGLNALVKPHKRTVAQP